MDFGRTLHTWRSFEIYTEQILKREGDVYF